MWRSRARRAVGVCTVARAAYFLGYGHFEVAAAVGKICLAVTRIADGERCYSVEAPWSFSFRVF